MPIIVKVFAVEPSCLPLKRYTNITIEYISANRVLINAKITKTPVMALENIRKNKFS